MIDEVFPDGVVDAGPRRHQHLGPDAVGRQHEDGLLHPGGHAHHAAERADLSQRQRRARGFHQLGDPPLGLLGRVEIDAGRGVAVRHADSGRSKCTRSRNARTRARTSAAVTLSNP